MTLAKSGRQNRERFIESSGVIPSHGIHKDFLQAADGELGIGQTIPGASANAVYRCNSSDSPTSHAGPDGVESHNRCCCTARK